MTTTTLGAPLVVKRMVGLCDGQCGGAIEVVTDGVHSGATYTDETEGRWVAGDGVGVVLDVDAATFEGACGATHGESLDRCNGAVLFGRDDFAAADWESAARCDVDLTPMDRA